MSVSFDNGNGLRRWISHVPGSVWVFLIGQLIAVVVWGVRLDARVSSIELEIQRFERHAETISTSLQNQITQLDNNGSRGLRLLQERQESTIRRMEGNEQRINRISDILTRAYPNTGPGDGR